jgi:type I restriction enzyme S subunit
MRYRLSDIFDLQMGKTPSRNNTEYWGTTDNKWISISDLSQAGKYIYDTKEYLSDEAIKDSGIKIIPANTVVMSFKLSIGKTAIVSEDMYSNEAIMAFHDKHVVEMIPEYIYYMFKYRDWDVGTNKAVMGKTLNKATLSLVEVDICDIERQREIVEILDKVVAVIDGRTKELNKLDNLIKARFVEMFGEPATNPMSWPIVSVGSMIESCEAGWSGKGQQREKKPGEIAVLKVSAITKGYFIPEECKVLDDQANIKKYVFPQKRDLLFSRANTREMVGATAVITEDFPELILPDKLWKIQFTEATNTWYMKYILSSKTIRDRVSAVSTGTSGSMYNISMEKLKAVQIPMPNFELQEQFAAFVAQVDKSKLLEQIRKITIRKEGITDDQL